MAIANFRVRTFKNIADLEFFIKTAIAGGVLTSGDHTFGFTFAAGATLIVEGSNDGGESFHMFRRSFAVGSVGPHADIAALLGELNTGARWNGASLPTEFLITNSVNKLVITNQSPGADFALRIGSESSALGGDTAVNLQFTASVKALGNKGSDDLQSIVNITPDDNGTFILSYLVS